ncbi:MAG: YIP1 family protein [Aliidiomarina sp.]|uniref:Yip1 family protein n=1 Tax=Aliidiomarina sp. TaxID=1872439 RepID=UPI0025C1F67F|nr:Yip1 family protein [Aliidiomarina sp.]MCH8501397.1 YIP1 family protein [Aliidiomarina sp.]
MILNHIWGLYAHPIEEWKTIDQRHESLRFSLSHILLVALIPCLAAYYASAHIGWSIGARESIFMTSQSAVLMAVFMYVGLIAGVLALSYLIHWMAKTFGAAPTFTQSIELAAYTATPVLMSGVAALYPELWFVAMVFLAGVAYSVYLLYSGVPILMHIPEERGFIYASSVVTAGLILMVVLMAGTVIAWTNGFIPTFVG